jgi:hypothetical protein
MYHGNAPARAKRTEIGSQTVRKSPCEFSETPNLTSRTKPKAAGSTATFGRGPYALRMLMMHSIGKAPVERWY